MKKTRIILYVFLSFFVISVHAESFYGNKSYNEVLKDSLLVEDMVYGYIFKPSFDGEYGVSYVEKDGKPVLIIKNADKNIFTMIDGQKYSSTASVNNYTGAPMKIKKRIEVDQENLVFDAKIATKIISLDKAVADNVVSSIKLAISQYKAPDSNPNFLIMDGEIDLFVDKKQVVEYSGYNKNDSSEKAAELIASILDK